MATSIEFALKLWMGINLSGNQSAWQRSDIKKLNIEALPQIEILLQNSGLPFEDCYYHINNFVGVHVGRELIAVGAVEYLGKSGLLRSLAVQSNYQGQGLAALIVDYLHQAAIKQGIETLYLLTETAAGFFLKLGYSKIDRDRLPPEVSGTKQCQSLCPASAQAMAYRLPVDKS